MANATNLFGLRPVRYFNGTPWNGQARHYYIPSTDSTALFIGDPVVFHLIAQRSNTPGWYFAPCRQP